MVAINWKAAVASRAIHSSATKTVHTASSLAGLSVGVILFVAAVVFFVMWSVLYQKAKKKQLKTGKPINHLKVVGMAALCAVGIGLIMLCLEGNGSDNTDNSNGQDVSSQEPMGYARNVQVPPMAFPNIYSGPVHDAAVDPIV